MDIVPCDQCQDMMINGVYSHECGCPNKDREPVYKDREYYEEIVSRPGKFEGEKPYVPFYWDAYLDGMADRDDGEVLGFDVLPEDKDIFPELKRRRTVKIKELDSGFVVEVK